MEESDERYQTIPSADEGIKQQSPCETDGRIIQFIICIPIEISNQYKTISIKWHPSVLANIVLVVDIFKKKVTKT